MKIAFVSYGRFDRNGGGHVTGFANRLAALGHRVAVFADGPPESASDFGPVAFQPLPRAALIDDAAAALAFDGHPPDPADTILHGWTPREAVRHALAAARRVGRFSTLLHLEEDERIRTAAHLGRPWAELEAMPPRALDAVLTSALAHPHRLTAMLAAADGLTAVVPPLFGFASGPRHLLPPGCDPAAPRPTSSARAALLKRLDAPAQAKLIVYPGDRHPANGHEVMSLYVAVEVLRRRGWPVVLVRTGEDLGGAADVAYASLRGRVSRELGRVSRAETLALISAADLLIQPGPPDAFNRCRLPSKLPEFFAAGRPVILPAANLGLLVKDGVEALISQRGDGSDLAVLAEALLRDPEGAEVIGEAGRRFAVKRLDWETAVRGLEAFYARILEMRQSLARSAA